MTRKYTSLPYTEYPVAIGNFDKSRKPITQIIIHSTVSTYKSAISWFGNPKAGTSAHYVISNKGELAAMLEEFYTAYHSGNYSVNQSSIGIEHEWYTGMTPSDELYKTSARLVHDICKYYGLGINRGVIKAHKEIVATKCPNAIDVDRIVREAQSLDTPPVDKDAIIEQLKKQVHDLKETEKRLVKEKNKAVQEGEEKLRQELAKKELECQEKINKTLDLIAEHVLSMKELK